MDAGEFFEEMQRHAPTVDRREAERAVTVVCERLGRHLTAGEVAAFARHVPEPVAAALGRESYDAERGLDDLFRSVATELGVEPARSRELVRTVGSLIAKTMDDEAVTFVRRLEPGLGSLFVAPAPVTPAEPLARGSASTIAAGRAGGRRPIADSRPGAEHPLSEADPTRGQPDSVAATEEPYRGEKISSGVTHDTLARGRPPGTGEGHD